MAKQKQSLPNAFEQARETGKIGGTGKRKDPTTDPETQKPINTGLQVSVEPETASTEGNESPNQMQNTQSQQVSTPQQQTQEPINTGSQKPAKTDGSEEIKKQTIDLPKSLARRVKRHATNRDEKIRDVHIRALEKLLAEEENQ
jgi:hypothetical protein